MYNIIMAKLFMRLSCELSRHFICVLLLFRAAGMWVSVVFIWSCISHFIAHHSFRWVHFCRVIRRSNHSKCCSPVFVIAHSALFVFALSLARSLFFILSPEIETKRKKKCLGICCLYCFDDEDRSRARALALSLHDNANLPEIPTVMMQVMENIY